MKAFNDEISSLLAAVQELHTLLNDSAGATSKAAAEPARSIGNIGAIRRTLFETAERGLANPTDIRLVELACASASAAIALAPAERALQSLQTDDAPAFSAYACAMLGIACKMISEACNTLIRVSVSGSHEGVISSSRTKSPREQRVSPTVSRSEARPELAVLRNIAVYDREHERYYTAYYFAEALDLSRDANRLKVLADAWLASDAPAAKAQVDYSDPRYQAAGCDDLNALRAIAGIGILFMEGEGEPAEIRAIKAMLRGRAMGLSAAGQWLVAKAEVAWEREGVLFRGELAHASAARFQTIVTNMVGAQTATLTGRVLSIATDVLDQVDFSPAALRANRIASATRIRLAGWLLDLAAQLLAKAGSDLARNDLWWTEYREAVDQIVGNA